MLGVFVGDREVVAKSIDDDDDCLVELFRVPAAAVLFEGDGWLGAVRFVVEDETSQEEALCEEVYAYCVERA